MIIAWALIVQLVGYPPEVALFESRQKCESARELVSRERFRSDLNNSEPAEGYVSACASVRLTALKRKV